MNDSIPSAVAERLRYLADTVPNDELPGELHAIAREIERCASPWRPISEATIDDLPFLGCHTSSPRDMIAICDAAENHGDGLWGACDGADWALTHFMPLPEPPEVEE
jgi:hypothetical protein